MIAEGDDSTLVEAPNQPIERTGCAGRSSPCREVG